VTTLARQSIKSREATLDLYGGAKRNWGPRTFGLVAPRGRCQTGVGSRERIGEKEEAEAARPQASPVVGRVGQSAIG